MRYRNTTRAAMVKEFEQVRDNPQPKVCFKLSSRYHERSLMIYLRRLLCRQFSSLVWILG
jgi:hypothetical protein